MAKMRIFLGVDISKAVRDRAALLQQQLGQIGAEVKWVEPANLHVTLIFLGEVDDRTLPGVCRVSSAAVAEISQFPMVVEGIGTFGNPRRPRTLWAGITEGAESLMALHAALEPPLLDLGCYRREDRSFTPHLTLGRVRSDQGAEELATAIVRHKSWKGGQVEVREVLVMHSELRSDGPEYSVVARARLAK